MGGSHSHDWTIDLIIKNEVGATVFVSAGKMNPIEIPANSEKKVHFSNAIVLWVGLNNVLGSVFYATKSDDLIIFRDLNALHVAFKSTNMKLEIPKKGQGEWIQKIEQDVQGCMVYESYHRKSGGEVLVYPMVLGDEWTT